MSARPQDWQPLAATDPIPGDVAAIHTEAARLRKVSGDIRAQITELNKIGDDDRLIGQYKDKLRSAARDLAGKLGSTADRYQKVSGHLEQWADQLDHAQAMSITALNDAQDAQRRITANQPAPPPPQGSPPPTPTPQQQAANTARQNALNQANADLAAAQHKLQQAESLRDNQGSYYAGKIRGDSDDALKDSWFDSFKDWVDQNQGWLSKLADVLGWIATALAIVALFIPGLNIIAFIVLGAELLIHVALAAAGDGSWLSVVLDIVSIVTLGAGMVAGKALGTAGKLAQTALKDGAGELGAEAWDGAVAATKVVRSGAGKVFVNDALRGTAEWTDAQQAASTAWKTIWAAKNSAIADAGKLAGAEFKPGFLSSFLSGSQEAAGIRQLFTTAAARFPGYAPLASAIAKGMPSFNLGQRLFLSSAGIDTVNHIFGGSSILGWSGFSWYNNPTTAEIPSTW